MVKPEYEKAIAALDEVEKQIYLYFCTMPLDRPTKVTEIISAIQEIISKKIRELKAPKQDKG